MRERELWDWIPPTVTQENPPEWGVQPWHSLLGAILTTVYPWDSESRRGWVPERLDGGDGPAT